MKPFASWVSDMANSIEDASHIRKDGDGNILPNLIIEEVDELVSNNTHNETTSYCSIRNAPANSTKKLDELHDAWMKRFDDEPTYSDDYGDYYGD